LPNLPEQTNVSCWLGHKDGGALAMKVYGHLQTSIKAKWLRKLFLGGHPRKKPQGQFSGLTFSRCEAIIVAELPIP
jgi:hypothetical protein